MIRTVLITTALLAAGAANAAEVHVAVAGKTVSALRVELAQAARTACKDVVSAPEYDACVQDAYTRAVDRLEELQAAKLAAMKASMTF
jgi:hypothetical protein